MATPGSQQLEANYQRLVAAPEQLNLLDQVAAQALQSGATQRAADTYLEFIGYHAEHAGAQFNCGYYCRAAGYYQQAIEHYQQALALGISQPEEVHTNIGVIYNEGLLQNDAAIAAFDAALKVKPGYVPALYNRANCYEQNGDKTAAAQYFSEVIKQAPNFAMAYVRLADVHRAEALDEPLILKLKTLVEEPQLPLTQRIDVAFALGKLLNDCQAYAEAWQFYQQANDWNATTMPAWEAGKQRELLNTLRTEFSAPLGGTNTAADDRVRMRPVFVCGMFRSGSTLVEQMLGAHTEIASGGELEFFPRLWRKVEAQGLASFLQQQTNAELAQLGSDYLNFVRERLGEVSYFTDKRPDTIWLLGLIKQVLPQAKFIVTRRQPLDNALSVYFTRLGPAMAYANRFEDILAFMEMERELLAHWQKVFGDDLQVVDYDELVVHPERELGAVLDGLGLGWQQQCLNFHKRANSVRTASVWQVRQPLYQSSSGRWSNYRTFLPK